MGHMPFLMPQAAQGALFPPADGAQLAAMRQLHAQLGHNRLLMDSLHDAGLVAGQDSLGLPNGSGSLVKSPKAHRFTPYSLPSLTGGDSAFHRLATGGQLPPLPVRSESASGTPSPKSSPTKG